jgi:hypothetical protein
MGQNFYTLGSCYILSQTVFYYQILVNAMAFIEVNLFKYTAYSAQLDNEKKRNIRSLLNNE